MLSAVVFFRGCNLDCPFCQNRELLAARGPTQLSEPELANFLRSRQGKLGGVVFTGGEPTLSPRLARLLHLARSLGFRTKLDTNGMRPELLAELLGTKLVDYLALDLKDAPDAYPEWLKMGADPAALLRSLELVKFSSVAHELRTTVVPDRHDLARLERMAEFAKGTERWYLQAYQKSPGRAAIDAGELTRLAAILRVRHGVPCYPRSSR